MLQYVLTLLCPHLNRRNLSDAHVRATKHLGHILRGVHGEADTGPDLQLDV